GVAREVGRTPASDERLDLLLLARLPLHEVADLRVVGVDHHHLGRPSGDAARLGGAGGAVEHFEEAHQAAGGAAAREPLHLPAQLGAVGAAARAVLAAAGLVAG